MTPVKFAVGFRERTSTNSTIFTDTNLKDLMNRKKIEIAKAVETADEDYFGTFELDNLKATSTTDFTLREYPLPNDWLEQIKGVEGKPDGTKWVRFLPFDYNMYNKTTDETTITNTFYNTQDGCYYDLFRGSIWIYTGTISEEITNGIKLFGYVYPSDVTDLTSETDLAVPSSTGSAIPQAFHDLWLDACVIEWKGSHDKPIPLTDREMLYKANLDVAVKQLRGTNKDFGLETPLPDSTDNDGYDN